MASACPKCGWQSVAGAQCPRCGVDVGGYRAELQTVVPPLPFSGDPERASSVSSDAPPSERRAAGFWVRVAAALVDAAMIVVAQGLLFVVAWAVFGGRSSIAIQIAAQVFGGMFIALYPVLFHWRWGQTLGKMAVDIRVVTCRPTTTSPGWLLDGGPLTLVCAAVRQLASVLSSAIFGIGYLMVGLRGDKRALHDLIAGTRVERLSRGAGRSARRPR